MTYNFNDKLIVIPDKEIHNLMQSLSLSKQDAIETWLADNDYEECEEQEELDKKAKKVKILKDITPKASQKERKPPEKKISSEKKELFNEILTHLQSIYGENVIILNENKLIQCKIGDISFKIDLIQSRPPKTK